MLQILMEAGMQGCKPIDTTMKLNHRLTTAIIDTMSDPEQFCHLVGHLVYLTISLA